MVIHLADNLVGSNLKWRGILGSTSSEDQGKLLPRETIPATIKKTRKHPSTL